MNRTYFLDPEISIVGELYQDAGGEYCSDFIRRGGTSTLRLGPDLLPAEDLDLRARIKLRESRLLAFVQNWLDGKLGCRRPKPMPTFEAIIEAHLDFNFSRIGFETAQTHRCAFLRVAETVWLQRGTGRKHTPRKGAEREAGSFLVADQPVTIINSTFGREYERIQLDGLVRNSTAWRNARSTAHTNLRWFRRMFLGQGAEALAEAGLVIPPEVMQCLETLCDDLELAKGPASDEAAVDREAEEEHVKAMHRLLWQLAHGPDEVLFLIVALALLCGVRHHGIATFQRGMLQLSSAEPVIIMSEKGKRRVIPLPRWLYDRLVSWLDRQPLGFLIPQDSGRDDIMELACFFLRQHGCGNNPLHQQRGYFAAYLIGTRETLDEIEEIFGHDDLNTMWTYYKDYPFLDHILDLWDTILPAYAAGAAPAP